jgi:pyruvate dehydrogenase (quinone)
VAVKLYLPGNIIQPNPEENVAQIVGSYLVDLMIRSGVRNIYGIVGDSANPVIDAIRESDGKLKFINVRNEEAGAFAAGADSQVSGRPTAVIGSS